MWSSTIKKKIFMKIASRPTKLSAETSNEIDLLILRYDKPLPWGTVHSYCSHRRKVERFCSSLLCHIVESSVIKINIANTYGSRFKVKVATEWWSKEAKEQVLDEKLRINISKSYPMMILYVVCGMWCSSRRAPRDDQKMKNPLSAGLFLSQIRGRWRNHSDKKSGSILVCWDANFYTKKTDP